jgi:putative addiction module component (TIGR02574 family)
MPFTKEQLLAEAMALKPEEREALAEELWLSIPAQDRQAVDAAWLAEARRRDAAFAAGQIVAVPVDEAMNRVLSRGRK